MGGKINGGGFKDFEKLLNMGVGTKYDDDDDSLLHIFALKMNYNMFTLAIRKNIKIYTF